MSTNKGVNVFFNQQCPPMLNRYGIIIGNKQYVTAIVSLKIPQKSN
jgi:hypothetical protein